MALSQVFLSKKFGPVGPVAHLGACSVGCLRKKMREEMREE